MIRAELEPGEILRWEGRPAPRCFTFRNWRHSLFGILLLLLALWWQRIGLDLAAAEGVGLLGWLPLPAVLAGCYLAFGHLLLARLEWERVAYAVTDRRVLLRRGLLRPRLQQMPLSTLRYVTAAPLGAHLGHLRLADADGRWLILCCLEHGEGVLPLLEAAIAANGVAVGGAGGETV